MKAYYKAQADTLRHHLSQIGISITHSQALETISKVNGFNNWDIFVAKLNSFENVGLRLNILYESAPEKEKSLVDYFLEMPNPLGVDFICDPPGIQQWEGLYLPPRVFNKEQVKKYLCDKKSYWDNAYRQDIMQERRITSEEFDILYAEYRARYDRSRAHSHSCIGKTSRGKRCLNSLYGAKYSGFSFFIKYKNAPFYYCDIHKDQVPYDQRKQFAIMFYDEYADNSPSIRYLREVFALNLIDARELHYRYAPETEKAE